jgi:Rad3-related DNA helicase
MISNKAIYPTWKEVAQAVLTGEIDVMEYFPATAKIKAPREVQVYAIKRIMEEIATGNYRVIMSGPPGVGKSLIAIWAINILLKNKSGKGNKATYTSPDNMLVDQLQNSFSTVFTLKGRKHYLCKSAYQSCTCEEAPCTFHRCVDRKATEQAKYGKRDLGSLVFKDRICESKSGERGHYCQEEDKCLCNDCYYVNARTEYGNAETGNTNFAIFQIGKILRTPNIYVIDEMEKSEGAIRLFRGITLYDDGINHKLPWDVMNGVLIETLEEKRDLLNTKEMSQKRSSIFDPLLVKDIKQLEEDIKKLEFIVEDYQHRKEPWVTIPIDKTINGKKITGVRFEPINTDYLLNSAFDPDDFVLLMSATPNQTPHIELDSPFPNENRPIYYYPIGKMSWEHKKKSIPEQAKFIIELSRVRKGKIVVHCGSYDMAKSIAIEFEKYNKFKKGTAIAFTMQVSTNGADEDYDTATRNKVYDVFTKSANTKQILLSVDMWSGVDFWQENITTQVFIKIPFLNPYDPVYKAKMNYVDGAEDQLIKDLIAKLEQGYGRHNRDEIKKTETYITDGSYKRLWDKHKNKFLKYYAEAVRPIEESSYWKSQCEELEEADKILAGAR